MNIDLRGYRHKVGMTQVQVANILGISLEEVCGYEEAPETVPILLQLMPILVFLMNS